MNKSVVTITRYWHNPQIFTTVNEELISLSISLDDFMKAVEEEIGSVTWTFRQATFSQQLEEAKKMVLEKVKEESIKVMCK